MIGTDNKRDLSTRLMARPIMADSIPIHSNLFANLNANANEFAMQMQVIEEIPTSFSIQKTP